MRVSVVGGSYIFVFNYGEWAGYFMPIEWRLLDLVFGLYPDWSQFINCFILLMWYGNRKKA